MSSLAAGAAGNESAVQWQWRAFDELDVRTLATVYRLRADVFVVEQQCVYQDIDGRDEASWHLLGWQPGTGAPMAELAAYLRLVPPGARFDEPSLGRVVVGARHRGTGLGRELMVQGLSHLEHLFPDTPVRISAQRHLQSFYESLGFAVCSAPYREDDIPHVEMLRAARALSAPGHAD